MAQYINAPIETDPDTLAQEAFDSLEAAIPGWLPSAGQLEARMVEAFARMAAEARDVASDVPAGIFRAFGADLLGVPPIDDVAASAATTWTMKDNAGYTIPAGTAVAIPASGSDLFGFEVMADVVVLPGATVTGAGAVVLRATEPGAASSGLTGVPTLLDPLEFVLSIALVGSTTGGVDAETDDEYLDRLSTELRLLTPRPIVPGDFTALARTRIPEVDRALALDGYNPDTLTFGNERYMTLAPVDAEGAALSAPVKATLDALLQSMREVSFIVRIIDPTYTAIAVVFTAVAYPGFSAAEVEAAAEANVLAYLHPRDWGQPSFGDQRIWLNTPVVRFLEVAAAINATDGLDYITALTVNAGVVDVNLTGAAPLPSAASTAAGTVT